MKSRPWQVDKTKESQRGILLSSDIEDTWKSISRYRDLTTSTRIWDLETTKLLGGFETKLRHKASQILPNLVGAYGQNGGESELNYDQCADFKK